MTVNAHESETNGLSSGKACSDLSVGLLGFVVDTVTLEEAFSAFPCQYKSIISPYYPFITDAT
jgi:hypothetical protein